MVFLARAPYYRDILAEFSRRKYATIMFTGQLLLMKTNNMHT